ncbi:inositol monophosphatase family protein [Franzmannia qiaohouensis]|uniref:Inositol-1-monophosphatase n=1 Tax=Franzmannia qiaohouensis TaxID=1329370 RepID=A0ABU1HEM3_9GAMM|nr:inositol monophosphatase family protein [Halomonas qiaohouensis]MDR5905920.1 inositol monophosphatase family protein [Halomonas qiaohouensis]
MRHATRLDTAIEIAHDAGRMIRDARRDQTFGQRYKAGHELVTDTDLAVDQQIAERLEDAFPGEARLTEELSPERDAVERRGPLWVIDPIDGTVNFAHGLAHVAVSIAWCEDGQTQLGVVHAPFLGETFSALRGEGAWRNGESIQASRCDDLNRALVATGFPYRRESRPPLLRRLQAVLGECQDIRRNGSAALDLCDVACGRLDAYYESVSPWDFAAGVLIAREAGARTGHLYAPPGGIPSDLYGENIVVAGQAIHRPLCELLKRADEGR